MATDYYELLGVGRNATEDDIKRAYRRLARQHHPDANPGDAESEARFKEISVAYETLRDPEKRRRYDMYGPEGVAADASGFEGFGVADLFDAFFGGDPFGSRRGPGGPARGADAEIAIELSFEEAVFGATRTIDARMAVECTRCSGSGCEPGTHPSSCRQCGGSGEVRQVRRSILGQLVTAHPCAACRGTGREILSPCHDCGGEGRLTGPVNIDVNVPAGIDDGQRLKLSGRGPAAARGGMPGDLYVTVRVRRDERFERQGFDLVHRCPITITQAALGAHLEIETLDGREDLVVRPGTQHGQVFRLRGRGVPALHGRGDRGDLLVVVEVVVPERLSREESDALRHYAELRGETVAPREEGFFSRIRSAFQ
jgi:molecular chaperone DnaJ